jgi:hypothetical protein
MEYVSAKGPTDDKAEKCLHINVQFIVFALAPFSSVINYALSVLATALIFQP